MARRNVGREADGKKMLMKHEENTQKSADVSNPISIISKLCQQQINSLIIQ